MTCKIKLLLMLLCTGSNAQVDLKHDLYYRKRAIEININNAHGIFLPRLSSRNTHMHLFIYFFYASKDLLLAAAFFAVFLYFYNHCHVPHTLPNSRRLTSVVPDHYSFYVAFDLKNGR